MDVVFQYQGLITEGYKSFFRKNVPDGVNLIFMEKREDESLIEAAGTMEVFVGYSLKPDFLKVARKLKHVQIPWTGFNNLGGEYLKDHEHVSISNSHSNSLAIAEHAVALMFSASKLLGFRDREMRKGDWTTRYEETNSVWITGKKVGVIGYGAIGSKVASMLKGGFGMEVLAIKRNPGERDTICDFLGSMNDLDHVLRESDFICISTPLTMETEGLIQKQHFKLMKPNAVLVNIARGPIIDEEALYLALKDNEIAAAGIDTWYNYPFGDQRIVEQNFPFEELENLVMTPHSAFKIRDKEEIFAQDILTNIIRVYEGKDPINQVNLELGY